MKRLEEVVEEYDPDEVTDRKKIQILEWFQKHPGKRFDIAEVHQELGDELDVGETRVGQILKELEEESKLESRGEQRKAYKLSEDILVPIKYQAFAGLRHLQTIIDVKRWGMFGFLAISTILWVFLTFPFWFFSLFLLISPQTNVGPLTQSEVWLISLSMTVWLLVLAMATAIVQKLRRRWTN